MKGEDARGLTQKKECHKAFLKLGQRAFIITTFFILFYEAFAKRFTRQARKDKMYIENGCKNQYYMKYYMIYSLVTRTAIFVSFFLKIFMVVLRLWQTCFQNCMEACSLFPSDFKNPGMVLGLHRSTPIHLYERF